MSVKITGTVTEMLEENRRRKQDYFRWYNPVLGDPLGEVVSRVPLLLDKITYFIPKAFAEDPYIKAIARYNGDLDAIAKAAKIRDKEQIKDTFFIRRLDYDFEFFCYTCSIIEDKRTGEPIKFFLNKGQRVLVKKLEQMRLSGAPIRLVLVKARQFGGSTVIVRYIQWLQLHVKRNWHSAIVSALQDQSVNLRADYESGIANLPEWHPRVTMRGVGASGTIKQIPQRGCKIKITSAEKPGALRSFSLKALHMTECGNWPSTAKKSGNEVAQAAYNTIPDEPDTFIALESTALGVGNFFHKQYQIAKSNEQEGRQGLRPCFVGFFMIDRYNAPIQDMKTFLKSLTAYNWWQWQQGATFESINWYRQYKAANHFTDFQMKSEFPTTADEAFQSNSGKYFTDQILAYMRRCISAPKFKGDIRGVGLRGSAALDGIELVENDSLQTEVLKIWIMPDDLIDKMNYRCPNRFIVTVDIGGTHYKSDYSVISVFDRMGLTEDNGALERAAMWRGHIDHDLLAWKAVQIAKFYDNALLVIESNTLETKDKKVNEAYTGTGYHFYTVLNEIQDVYSNLYMREGPADKITGLPTMKIGWHMNKVTKYQAYDRYTYLCREKMFIEHDDYAVDEAGYMEVKSNGEIGNIDGEHDDVQDTNAVAAYVSTNYKVMPMPKLINLKEDRIGPKTYVGGVANF